MHYISDRLISIQVIGATTSPPPDIASARSQLELLTLLPILYGNGLATCFPCPPDLLAEIIRVNYLRSVFQAVPTDSTTPILVEEGKSAAALDILRRIKAFSVEKWADEVVVGIGGSQNAGFEVGLAGWREIADIYKSAVAIYCIASLFWDNSGDNTDGQLGRGQPEIMTQVRETCRRVLMGGLREANKCTRLRKLVLWPLLVAGVEAAEDDDATRMFVGDELRWISKTLGTAAPLVARDLLEKNIWARGLGRGGWDGLFDQPYVFVL